ncbi:MAG: hypothetical protein GY859_25820, partial [Desulfobacterales bacterium]|nr:hypothetical protein [Desulfobacterales bacterium]
MKETDPIRDQALRRGAALANNVMRYYHALFELRRLSLILFSQGPARDSDIEAWLRQEDFGPREGFWLNRSLLERFRSGTAPGDAISHSWSETLKDYRDARFRMYCLKDIGPHLLEIHSHLPSAAWLYYQDVTNTSIQFPYIDQMEAIEPSFDWSTYHTFQAVEPGANPGRDIKWTPPTIDYAGEGLIISVSIPVYQGDEFIGLWSIDVPMALLYQEYITETVFPDQDNFIINNEGDIVVHKDIRANIDREKGSVFLEKVSALGGDFRSLNPGELMKKGRGGLTLRMADGRELLAYYKSIPEINWIFVAAVPRDRMLDVVNTRVREALERVKIGDFNHRIEECSGMEQTRLLVEGYNEMVSALQAQEAVRLRAMEA